MAQQKLQEVRDKIFDLLLESKREEHRNSLESFDQYKARTKQQYHQMFNTYLKEIQHGYALIIDELAKQIERAPFIKR